MRKYVERLVLCGVPRQAAMCVCAEFRRRGKMAGLKQYVALMEDMNDV